MYQRSNYRTVAHDALKERGHLEGGGEDPVSFSRLKYYYEQRITPRAGVKRSSRRRTRIHVCSNKTKGEGRDTDRGEWILKEERKESEMKREKTRSTERARGSPAADWVRGKAAGTGPLVIYADRLRARPRRFVLYAG